jgi:hypothetical protein
MPSAAMQRRSGCVDRAAAQRPIARCQLAREKIARGFDWSKAPKAAPRRRSSGRLPKENRACGSWSVERNASLSADVLVGTHPRERSRA